MSKIRNNTIRIWIFLKNVTNNHHNKMCFTVHDCEVISRALKNKKRIRKTIRKRKVREYENNKKHEKHERR